MRAIEPHFGLEWMRLHRRVAKAAELTNGPAKLCAALKIDRRFDGADLCDLASPMYLASNPGRDEVVAVLGPVIATSRVGMTQAADWPLRFYLDRSKCVSRRT